MKFIQKLYIEHSEWSMNIIMSFLKRLVAAKVLEKQSYRQQWLFFFLFVESYIMLQF